MYEIQLLGLEFFARHGIYEQERESGNTFMVDLKVIAACQDAASTDNISNTVDYEKLYALTENVMRNPVNLLETVADSIKSAILVSYPSLDKLEVSVAKRNPPIGGKCFEARVTVKYSKK